jgi:hypothetical protein
MAARKVTHGTIALPVACRTSWWLPWAWLVAVGQARYGIRTSGVVQALGAWSQSSWTTADLVPQGNRNIR